MTAKRCLGVGSMQVPDLDAINVLYVGNERHSVLRRVVPR
jgi:hypothetical protein